MFFQYLINFLPLSVSPKRIYFIQIFDLLGKKEAAKILIFNAMF